MCRGATLNAELLGDLCYSQQVEQIGLDMSQCAHQVQVSSHIASREQDEEPHQTPNLCFQRLEPKRNLLVEPAIGINEEFLVLGGGRNMQLDTEHR